VKEMDPIPSSYRALQALEAAKAESIAKYGQIVTGAELNASIMKHHLANVEAAGLELKQGPTMSDEELKQMRINNEVQAKYLASLPYEEYVKATAMNTYGLLSDELKREQDLINAGSLAGVYLFGESINKSYGDFTGGVYDFFGGVGDTFSGVSDALGKSYGDFTGGITDAFSGVSDLFSGVGDAFSGVSGALGGLQTGITGGLIGIGMFSIVLVIIVIMVLIMSGGR